MSGNNACAVAACRTLALQAAAPLHRYIVSDDVLHVIKCSSLSN